MDRTQRFQLHGLVVCKSTHEIQHLAFHCEPIPRLLQSFELSLVALLHLRDLVLNGLGLLLAPEHVMQLLVLIRSRALDLFLQPLELWVLRQSLRLQPLGRDFRALYASKQVFSIRSRDQELLLLVCGLELQGVRMRTKQLGLADQRLRVLVQGHIALLQLEQRVLQGRDYRRMDRLGPRDEIGRPHAFLVRHGHLRTSLDQQADDFLWIRYKEDGGAESHTCDRSKEISHDPVAAEQ